MCVKIYSIMLIRITIILPIIARYFSLLRGAAHAFAVIHARALMEWRPTAT